MLDIVDPRTLQREAFLEDVIAGLSRPCKQLPSRWLYDEVGSELFEAITHLDEYYPTRTETTILREHGRDMAAFLGPDAVVLEYGAGAAIKTRLLLDVLRTPRAYVPIDIAGEFLERSAQGMRERYQRVPVVPVMADFTTTFDLPYTVPKTRRVVFFPGSTIGNLDATQIVQFLNQARRHTGQGGSALIGIDLRKSLGILLPAYDDRLGVTAAFDLNLLWRINRELGGTFRLDDFHHEARWNEAESAVEMHLVSRRDQIARVDGHAFSFRVGETIHTESSRKFDLEAFGALASRSGWRLMRKWLDAQRLFAVVGLRAVA